MRAFLSAAIAAAACCVVAPIAQADETPLPTTQAKAYNADFVPYLDPPEHPAAVCLVDSGVDVTPDTPADSADGPIVKRLSLDGGPGTAANTTWAGGHGTRMAFVGSAPINDWGAVGFWPGARIISIRAMPTDGTTFPFSYYSKAVDLCNKRAVADSIVAVNLSLGCDCAPTAAELARLDNQIVAAHSNDQSVIAAAGNSASAVGSPANRPGVLAVAAGDRSNALCSFSNRGAAVDLVAPGCDIDLADPVSGQVWSEYASGTSGASMTASMVLALLRSYRPNLSWQAAEQLIEESAQGSAEGPLLDVEALFRSAGLSSLVDAASARAPAIGAPPSPGSASSTATTSSGVMGPPLAVHDDGVGIWLDKGAATTDRLPAPRLDSILHLANRLIVSVNNRPRGAHLVVLLKARLPRLRGRTVARVSRRTNTIRLRLPRAWRGGRLILRYQLPDKTSPSVHREVQG